MAGFEETNILITSCVSNFRLILSSNPRIYSLFRFICELSVESALLETGAYKWNDYFA